MPPLISATCASSFNTKSFRPATLLPTDGVPTDNESTPVARALVGEDVGGLGFFGVAVAGAVGATAAGARVESLLTLTSTQLGCAVQRMRSGVSKSNSISLRVVFGKTTMCLPPPRYMTCRFPVQAWADPV